MKEDLLKDFRSDYVKELKKKVDNDKYLEVLNQRKSILENSPLVKDYIRLNEQIEECKKESYSIDRIFSKALLKYVDQGLTEETNQIYLYLGTYYSDGMDTVEVERNSSDAVFDWYVDIESVKYIENPVEDRNIFEENNKVVLLDNYHDSKYLLCDIRNQFIHDALCEGQDIACKKVLSRK